jgi:hypothetical protein
MNSKSDLPELAAPAMRALDSINIKSLKGLTKKTEKEIMDLHGMGPKAMRMLKEEMEENGVEFKK